MDEFNVWIEIEAVNSQGDTLAMIEQCKLKSFTDIEAALDYFNAIIDNKNEHKPA